MISDPPADSTQIGRVRELNGGFEDYLRALESAFPLDLSGLRVMLDCANGATHRAGPAIFERLGAEVEAIAIDPDGRNINADCGSTHVDRLAARIEGSEATIGFAFDGDGDRVLVADAAGQLLDGDDLLAILAEDAVQRGALPGRTVVATVMSNLGLEDRLRTLGARLERTPVGDRNVAERMRALHAPFGGEASGHVVLARPLPGGGSALLGDALVAGVRVLQAARRLGKTLSVLRAQRPRYPQVLRNVRMKERRPLESWDALQRAIRAEESRLGTRGRVLVRYSGTEPLLRIMVEGQDAAEVERSIASLEQVARA
jgi:phosphoglucosamine mutase